MKYLLAAGPALIVFILLSMTHSPLFALRAYVAVFALLFGVYILCEGIDILLTHDWRKL